MKTIFTTKQVKKYFYILEKMERSVNPLYGGICSKEVFVKRTLGKWFKNKTYQLLINKGTGFFENDGRGYSEWNNIEITLPNYLYISLSVPHYTLGYGDSITVNYCNATGYNLKDKLVISHNEALELKGKEITEKKFKSIQKLFYPVTKN